MTRFVIGPDVALRLAHDKAVIGGEHQILAPTLLRSHVLSLLYLNPREAARIASSLDAAATDSGVAADLAADYL